MKTKKKFFITLITLLLFGSIIVPIIIEKITYVEAARIEVKITWATFWCRYSRDSDPDGEFYLQFKYYDNSLWRIEKTSNKKIAPNYPNPSYPNITYTLKYDVQVGTNLYIRLMEKDWLKDDLVIPYFMENHGSGDSAHWDCFYISSSFTEETCIYYNPDLERIEVNFINLG
ncbi:MAG: hypothetical protein HZR80_12635 [Candidatus Heimdallarchaeota archaeon]